MRLASTSTRTVIGFAEAFAAITLEVVQVIVVAPIAPTQVHPLPVAAAASVMPAGKVSTTVTVPIVG